MTEKTTQPDEKKASEKAPANQKKYDGGDIPRKSGEKKS